MMYVRLFISIFAAMILILLARKHPVIVSVVYFLALMYFVGFSSGRTDLGTVSIRFPMPFYRAIKAHHYGLTTNRSVLNVILFVPFGYLLPTFLTASHTRYNVIPNNKDWEHMVSVDQRNISWWLVIGAGLLCSLMIESSQLIFRFGVFELDDLVKNTMGTTIGWLIWKGMSLKLQKDKSSKPDR